MINLFFPSSLSLAPCLLSVSLMSGKLEIIQRGNSTLRCSSIIVCQSWETDKLLTCQSTHQTADSGLWDWSMEEKKKIHCNSSMCDGMNKSEVFYFLLCINSYLKIILLKWQRIIVAQTRVGQSITRNQRDQKHN